MKYTPEYILKMLNGILEWRENDSEILLYREIQILKRMIEIDLGLDDY